MTPREWIVKKWRERRQRIDLEILWPSMKRIVEENYASWRRYPEFTHIDSSPEAALERARQVFLNHMKIDPAWRDQFDNAEDLGEFVRTKLV